MFELLTVIVFVWLLIKAIGFAFRLTWGIAKISACILMVIAAPVLILCLLFASGLLLLIPVANIGIAAGILKSSAN